MDFWLAELIATWENFRYYMFRCSGEEYAETFRLGGSWATRLRSASPRSLPATPPNVDDNDNEDDNEDMRHLVADGAGFRS
jgi:hypothetical protein